MHVQFPVIGKEIWTLKIRSNNDAVEPEADEKLPSTEWSPLRQEPEAPSNNATSRNCLLAPTRHLVPGASKRFPPRREPGDAKARDNSREG